MMKPSSDAGCTDTVELLLSSEEELTENEKKVLLYIHKWNKNHFAPLKASLHDHLLISGSMFEKLQKHIDAEDNMKNQFNRIEALLWSLGICFTGIVALMGTHVWDHLVK